jgi:hypothetical protein
LRYAAGAAAHVAGENENLDLGFISRLANYGRIMLESRGNLEPNRYLKKLAFHIETDVSLNEAKECFLCFEENMHAKLGCSHEYCIDCICGTAKARTKSFITCAMCRAEVDVVQVGSESIKAELQQKINAL